MNYSKTGKHIAETIHKVGGKALTHNQHLAMVGAIAVWTEKAVKDERERLASVFDKEADRQEEAWNSFVAKKETDKHATSFHTIFRGVAEAIRRG